MGSEAKRREKKTHLDVVAERENRDTNVGLGEVGRGCE